jgi:hypothetical protein
MACGFGEQQIYSTAGPAARTRRAVRLAVSGQQ